MIVLKIKCKNCGNEENIYPEVFKANKICDVCNNSEENNWLLVEAKNVI